MSAWQTRALIAAAAVVISCFSMRISGRLLKRWFMSAWERTAAGFYLKMLPKWVLFLKLYIFACTGYFNRARNALYVSYASALLCSIMLTASVAFGGFCFYFGLFLLLLSVYSLAECLVFDFRMGTDLHRHPMFDRYAPLCAGETELVRREKRETHFTRFLGVFQKDVSMDDEVHDGHEEL